MQLSIGQRVSVLSYFGLKHGFLVTKISKTGQITVEKNDQKYRFLPTGYEIGNPGFYGKARLVI